MNLKTAFFVTAAPFFVTLGVIGWAFATGLITTSRFLTLLSIWAAILIAGYVWAYLDHRFRKAWRRRRRNKNSDS